MSKYYLLVLPPDTVKDQIAFDRPNISLHNPAPYIQVDDILIPVRAETKTIILPAIYKVTYIQRNTNTMTLQLMELYNRAVPLQDFDEIRPQKKTFQYQTQLLALEEFTTLTNRMGGRRMEEKALLAYIKEYITAKGFYFDDETLFNYHICLKTRPFIILAGLSGTGKSKLSQLYAEALGHKKHYLRLPVRPNWNDDHFLLGHINILTGEYVTEAALEFLLEANQGAENLYFFCLDEMNLAHVEYYFSQFLSAMEEEEPEERIIHIFSKQTQQQLEKLHPERSVAATITIPNNLFFTGTINVDETTQPISDKVIDRANTLEFFSVELDKIPAPGPLPEIIELSTLTWQSYQVHTPDNSYRNKIIEISKILNKGDLGLGYRVLREIELYLAKSKELLEPQVAFDLQVKQRILPRVRGSAVISNMMKELLVFVKQNKLPRSEKRLIEMNDRLERDGYTSFWR